MSADERRLDVLLAENAHLRAELQTAKRNAGYVISNQSREAMQVALLEMEASLSALRTCFLKGVEKK